MCQDSQCLHIIDRRIKIEEGQTELHKRKSETLYCLFWAKLTHRVDMRQKENCAKLAAGSLFNSGIEL